MRLIVEEVMFWASLACAVLTGVTAVRAFLAGSWVTIPLAACCVFWVVIARCWYEDVHEEADR